MQTKGFVTFWDPVILNKCNSGIVSMGEVCEGMRELNKLSVYYFLLHLMIKTVEQEMWRCISGF